MPREPRRGQLSAQRRLYERFDAIVVHTEHGRRRLTGELGIDPVRVHVIPHGAFTHLAAGPRQAPPFASEKPVVLCFGLMRPYKGIDVLVEAWKGIENAELWIAGMPRMDISALRAAAPPNVRFVPRFIGDDELPAYFQRADLVVLPYREIDQSGVLFTALAFGKPLLLSDAGALGKALRELLGDPAARAEMSLRAGMASEGEYSWENVARRHLELYSSLLDENPPR
jgi:glycosyltransferase involved in cell wall biosynthesis